MPKTLILIAGNSDNIFLKNEIPYMKKYFDSIYILAYNRRKKKNICGDKIESIFIKNFTLRSLVKSFINLINKKEIRGELRRNNSLEKYFYAYFYENFYCNMQQAIDEKGIEGDIYLYSFWLSRGAYAVARYKSEHGEKVKRAISRAHGYDLYEDRNRLKYLPFRNYIKENLDQIFFVSEHGRNYFLNQYGRSKCRYEISRLGSQNREGLKKEILKKETVCIASCSAMIEVKRIDLLIKILEQLEIPYKWIHLGDGKLRNKLEEYANEKLPQVAYKFLGKVDNNKILKIYQKYDVDFFINTSDSEGIPVSIMEAMSVGIPVICREVGGNAEIVNNENGLLLSKDEESISICEIEKFLRVRVESEEKYQKMSNNCVLNWREHYYAEKNYEEFYRKILGEGLW